MWLFTNFGFFSAVEHRDDPNDLLVRGRVLADIELLALLVHGNTDAVQLTPAADYPYRVRMTKRLFANQITMSINAIDYDNFKNSVRHEQTAERAHVYGNVWGQLHELARVDDAAKLARKEGP